MITKNEVSTLNLSPTKKDFVQIWGELIDVAGKLSERWDPTSTNESDPGIVILKALTGIADKLNYNIDKNILEAFMPTAAQEESMRKLCEMMGYNIKYLRSATTSVTIRYSNPDPSEEEYNILKMGLAIPKFTNISSASGDINYFTTNQLDLFISKTTPKITVDCMEGQIVKCESLNPQGIITIGQLTDDNRYYLPEIQIAENGIFVYNVAKGPNNTLVDGNNWKRVDNLNTQGRMSYVFKFGFDSYEKRPYIEFPDDVSELINDGLFIYYTRTKGINGNVSPRVLTQLEVPVSETWNRISTESFIVENTLAATNGADIETIEDAYNGFKKTIGTFETLVTCRDYMNKIYSMMSKENKPYVSNVLVTDIRNDLNRAITICSCDDSGICYKEKPLTINKPSDTYKPTFSETRGCWIVGVEASPIILDSSYITSAVTSSGEVKTATDFFTDESGTVIANKDNTWSIWQKNVEYVTNLPTLPKEENLIDHFDLVLYPFKTYNQITSNVKDILPIYENSFKYSETNVDIIKTRLEENKTVAHNFTQPKVGDILSINNYYRLNAFIATTNKITAEEGTFIIDKIKMALSNAFNMRELDFGEEIPFDRILEVIEQADPRIKVASLAEPTLYTTYSVLKGRKLNVPQIAEYAIASKWLANEEAKELPRIFEEELSIDYTCADFYFEKEQSTGKYFIYTYIDGIKKYLCAYQTDVNRDKDAFLCYESIETLPGEDIDLSTLPKNKAFTWSCEEESQAWVTSFKYIDTKTNTEEEKVFFLGAYGDHTYLSISSIDWLKTPKNEFIASFCKSSVVPSAPGSISPAKITDVENNTPYKLFINQTSLDDSANKIFYVLPAASPDHKFLYTTVEPYKPVEVTEIRYTFNTTEAKSIYNKLAIRNILAGRLPLFNYNETFDTSFSESPYLVTKSILLKEVPSNIRQKLATNNENFSMYYDTSDDSDIAIYTKQTVNNRKIYTKTYNPYKTIITGGQTTPIKELETFCKITSDSDTISDVTLENTEVIKFRAPNFVTTTTYPAYVNYNLRLSDPISKEAEYAKGVSLKDLLNYDSGKYSEKNYITNWEKTFNYFESNCPDFVKTQNLVLPVSKYKPFEMSEPEIEGDNVVDPDNIEIEVKEPIVGEDSRTLESIIRQSGCLYLTSFTPTLTWNKTSEDYNESELESAPDLNLKLTNITSPFITSMSTITSIKEAVEATLNELKGSIAGTNPDGSPDYVLPTECDWTISFEFKYLLLEPQSLDIWQAFLMKYCDLTTDGSDNAKFNLSDGDKYLINKGEKCYLESSSENKVLYRLYSGHTYNKGKFIAPSGSKYILFDKTAFSVLPLLDYFSNLYILTSPGKDQELKNIKNGTEYQLQKGEYLFINYTPSSSSTTSEGSAEATTEPINKYYSAGDIIRPSGFTNGLSDSVQVAAQGRSWAKQATFEIKSSENLTNPEITPEKVNLLSIGPNEQIEIRDFAEVTLSKDTLGEGNSTVYLYKNFVCPELEGRKKVYDAEADLYKYTKQYTLKEGEYIFYTDQNMSETAYFTNGTLVTLTGGFVMSETQEIIDIGTILDSGLQEIPWQIAVLRTGQELKFTEFQYVTLGKGDTLGSLTLTNKDLVDNKAELDKTWRACTGDTYYYDSTDLEKETKLRLPTIYTKAPGTNQMLSGNGWEACSVAELNTSPTQEQTLRKGTQVVTGLNYLAASEGGYVLQPTALTPETDGVLNANPVSFKTDIRCQAIGTTANKNTISTVNPSDVSNLSADKGFSLKVFARSEPLYVETIKGKPYPVVPADFTVPYDISKWSGTPVLEKDFNDIWSRANFENMRSTSNGSDKALKLPVLISPDTYGVASFYVNYTTTLQPMSTWIELPLGYQKTDIEVLNDTAHWNLESSDQDWIADSINRLYLSPGLNCLKFRKSGDLIIKTSSNSQGELYFDDLRLVSTIKLGEGHSLGLNLDQIDYQYIGDSTDLTVESKIRATEEQLLADLRSIDHQRDFYYNAPVEKNMAIEFNKTRLGSDTLMNPNINYDLNNVNNPFVISKLDIDYLQTGIQIARSSRLN